MQVHLRMRTEPLKRRELLHLKAAEYWLALGNIEDAQRELEAIGGRHCRHPHVQAVFAKVEAATRYVAALIDDGQVLSPYWDNESVEMESAAAIA